MLDKSNIKRTNKILMKLIKTMIFYPLFVLRGFLKDSLAYFGYMVLFSSFILLGMSITRPPFPYLYSVIFFVIGIFCILFNTAYDSILIKFNPTGKTLKLKEEI